MQDIGDLKIAILTPFLNFYGGAEYQISIVVNDIFPNADVFTFSYDKKLLKAIKLLEKRVMPILGKGLFSKFYKQMTPFYPSLIDTTELHNYDLVLSFSYGYVHGVVTDSTIPHIAHIETPMRLLWEGESQYYIYDKIPGIRQIYRTILAYQRKWDRQAASRPDYLLANSREISRRIKRVWSRESDIVYPPVETGFYNPKEDLIENKEEYYVTHSRLVRYKRIDILVEGMRRMGRKLIVIGDGPEFSRLRHISRNSKWIEFTGYISDQEKRGILQKGKGFLYASHEDFGISPVEAMAAGLPVYAYNGGGATETLVSSTSMLFNEQNVESFINSFRKFDDFASDFNSKNSINRAEKFSKIAFKDNYLSKICEYRTDFIKNGPPVLD